ncbi:uncharacterized protein LOC135824268 [Sycon ciliatum]|uniref:uncharacterized protein LOC135824268 n=1 Tax=Sycon ciliatum TaxID=27933 RepID=UPI0031F6F885
MAAVNDSQILRYAREDKVEAFKAEILEGGVLKKEIKLRKTRYGDPLLARFLKDACSHNATSVVKFLASTVDKYLVNHEGHYSYPLPTGSTITYGSALHAAGNQGSVNCVQYLLDAGADPNVTDRLGKTPLHYASERGRTGCMRHLLDSKANPNQPDNDKRTPLHYATIENKADCVLHLLQAGANPDQGDERGETPLHYASERGRTGCMRHLLGSKANPNQQDNDKRTPLHYATIENKADCVLHLLQAGANPDQGDERGETPLHYASEQGCVDCILHLLDSKAKPNQCDEVRRDSPPRSPNATGSVAVQDSHRPVRPSTGSTAGGPSEYMYFPLASVFRNGHTPLDIAAKKGRLHFVKRLVHYMILYKTTTQQCLSLFVQACAKSADDCAPVLQDGILDCIVGVHISQEDNDAWTEVLGRLSEQCILSLTQKAITIRKDLPPPLLQVSLNRIRRKTNQQSPLVVRLLGHPGGGKSSLLESILHRRHFFGKVVNFFRGDQCDTILASRTRGMRRYVDDDGTIYLDLGGQYRFMSQHQRLTKFSDVWALNLLTVSGMESSVNMRRWIRTWADFIACSCAEGTATRNKALIVVTRRDRLSKEQMTAIEKECATLQKILGVHLEFLDEPIPFVKAISETCEGVAALRELIQRHKEKVQQASGPDSEVVVSISEALLENVRDQCRDSPAISTDQFMEFLATAIARFDYKCVDSSILVVLKALKEGLDVNMELFNLHQKALLRHTTDECGKKLIPDTNM